MRFGQSQTGESNRIRITKNKIFPYKSLLDKEIEIMLKKGEDITNLWRKRGIIWK